MSKTILRSLSALALLSVLTACSQQATPADLNRDNVVSVEPSASSREILRMYRATSSDVNLVDDPDELTPKAELIVEGQIVGFSTGRHWQFGGEGTDPVTSTIMKVIVSKKFKGAPGYVNSTVYVEHFLAFDVDLNELNSSLVGYQCGLFLIEAAGAGTAGLLDPTGGRPLGQKLWVAGGQTFVVQDKSKTQVVWPSLQEVTNGKLADAMPGGALVPSGE